MLYLGYAPPTNQHIWGWSVPKKIDLCGKKFGRWTVKARLEASAWDCICDCGTRKRVLGNSLVSGKSTSCGCRTVERCTTHGMEGTATYNAWASMLTRCRNPNNKFYAAYGGRGISVCKRWEKFENFLKDMGEKPRGLALDRFPDNDGDYKKSNCRWTTQKEQIRNRRTSPKFEWNGEMRSLASLAEEYKLPWRKVYERIRQGWSIKDALTIKRATRWNRKWN